MDITDDKEKKLPIREEVTAAIKKLKNNKVQDSRRIAAELIKERGKRLMLKIHKIISEAWETKQLPREWNLGIIIPYIRKGTNILCETLRLDVEHIIGSYQ